MIQDARSVPRRYYGAILLSLPLLLFLYLITASRCMADADQEATTPQHAQELDSEIQVLKNEVLKVNRDLQQLEEDLLYPQDQQLVVFVSIVNDGSVQLKAVRMRLDGQPVATHVYSRGEEAALHQGGVHRIYVGAIRKGEHTLGVVVDGTNTQDAEFNLHESKTITKATGIRYVELRLHTDPAGRKPAVSILEW